MESTKERGTQQRSEEQGETGKVTPGKKKQLLVKDGKTSRRVKKP